MKTKLEDVCALSDEKLRIRVAELCGWKLHIIRPERLAAEANIGVLIKYYEKAEGYWIHEGQKFNFTIPYCDTGPTDVFHGTDIPNYPQDLNAMHEAEKSLNDAQYARYQERCRTSVGYHWFSASAKQRAQAFILTMEEN